MTLKFEKEVEDKRGKIFFLLHNKTRVNIVEIRKGYSRGGHYHNYPTTHLLLLGRVEYKAKDINSKTEFTKVFLPGQEIKVPAYEVHILTALEDSLFAETSEREFEATNYPEYRKIVEEKMMG